MSIACRLALASAAALSLSLSRAGNAQQAADVGDPSRAALVARLDSIATEYVREQPVAGMTIAVVRRGDTLLLEGYGERDREKHLPADAGTVYRVGSITKQFTTAAVMRLVEKGSVKLDDPITRHLPQYEQWSAVTIRQLLAHTSGIRSYTSSAAWRAQTGKDMTPAAVVAFVEKDTMDFAPGSAWRYNNTGYMLLGMLLEKATGQTYAALLERDYFKPLGMHTATYCPSKPGDASHAVGYVHEGGSWKAAEYLSMTHPYSAGALCMSVPDYLRWQSALHGGSIVSARSLALMAGPETLTVGARKGTTTGYGMGLARGDVGGHATVQHGGSINGFSSQQYWFPADSLSIVAFVNTVGAEQDALVNNLALATLGMPTLPRRPAEVPLTAAARAKYEGAYDIALPDGRILPFRIFAEGDLLFGQAEGQGRWPLRYIGDDTFGAEFDPTLRLALEVKDGKVVGGTLTQRGQRMNVIRRQ